MNFLYFYGQFHPAFVHFPVALLLAAALAELIFWLRPRRPFHQIVSLNLHLGAVSAFVAAAMGWCLAATMGIEPDLRRTLFWHRWLGMATVVWAVLTVLLWWWYELRSTTSRRVYYRAALFLKFSARDTIYNHFNGAHRNFNGSGRNAFDNNTLYLEAWNAL